MSAPTVLALRAELEADAALLTAIVARRWVIAPDPFGTSMLLPRGDGDPLPVDAVPWPALIDEFIRIHGRRPRAGARTLAARDLTEHAVTRGGRDG